MTAYPERLTLGMCPETRGPFMCSCGGGDFDTPCAEVEVEYVRADLHRVAVEALEVADPKNAAQLIRLVSQRRRAVEALREVRHALQHNSRPEIAVDAASAIVDAVLDGMTQHAGPHADGESTE